MTFWVTCVTHIWPINPLASHLTPGSLVRTCTHGWNSTDISNTLNWVPTLVHTLPSHEHLGNHPEDWFPSITSRIITISAKHINEEIPRHILKRKNTKLRKKHSSWTINILSLAICLCVCACETPSWHLCAICKYIYIYGNFYVYIIYDAHV